MAISAALSLEAARHPSLYRL